LKTFRQDDIIGAERRKTAAGSPKGERSESICRIYRRIVKWPCDKDGLRRLGGSASSPDPFFNHGGVESLSDSIEGN
jgi:hypothetical protein